jgi:hypothetical protein
MMPHFHPGTVAAGRASRSWPACTRPGVSSCSSLAAHVSQTVRPHAAAAHVPLLAPCGRAGLFRWSRMIVEGSSNGAAATVQTSGPEAAVDAEGATSGTAGSRTVDQQQWEAEIEETLKLVRLLPPSGECCSTKVPAEQRWGGPCSWTCVLAGPTPALFCSDSSGGSSPFAQAAAGRVATHPIAQLEWSLDAVLPASHQLSPTPFSSSMPSVATMCNSTSPAPAARSCCARSPLTPRLHPSLQ